jgi:predicted trehalose synthase
MVRSWSYAAAAASRAAGGPPRATALMQAWEMAVRQRFLQGYWNEAGRARPAFLPGDTRARDTLLALFELRKALYEVQYELNNRPDWVEIPAGALPAILQRLAP